MAQSHINSRCLLFHQVIMQDHTEVLLEQQLLYEQQLEESFIGSEFGPDVRQRQIEQR